MKEEKCLEIVDWQDPFGKNITMNFYPEKSLIDLNPFFQDFFRERNSFFGIPTIVWKNEKNLTEYQFSLSEFAGAFLLHGCNFLEVVVFWHEYNAIDYFSMV